MKNLIIIILTTLISLLIIFFIFSQNNENPKIRAPFDAILLKNGELISVQNAYEKNPEIVRRALDGELKIFQEGEKIH